MTAGARWQFQSDMNADGDVTTFDVVLWYFFAPGDALFDAIMLHPDLATFLGITPLDYGSWLSGAVSAGAWVLLAMFVVWLFREV